ncbi:hypothetical protein, conserved [Plasmodium gonderi]|uniref:Uncharacterized protein n=1 Tax=Plasmodium gonderi TaxID=77519 RepID=A0A1Y1JRX4_PLAGO|nr:hypothetical protein, conserved [Plasmodium gonderi]GAW82754.1 hypothetical protein, conserved [Plasmodium gonderi]
MKSSSRTSTLSKDDECLEKVCLISKNNGTKGTKKEQCNDKNKICKLKSKNSVVKREKSDTQKENKKSDSTSNESIKESLGEGSFGEDSVGQNTELGLCKEEEGDAGDENKDIEFGDARKYFKEGQKCITPPNGDGTRAFYESLLEENPNSIIAIKYCIEYGILSGTKHHETLHKYNLLKRNNAFRSNFGGLRYQYVKLLEEPPKSNDGSHDELIKKEILSK